MQGRALPVEEVPQAGKGAWGRGAAALSPIIITRPFGDNRTIRLADKNPAKRPVQLNKKVFHFFIKLCPSCARAGFSVALPVAGTYVIIYSVRQIKAGPAEIPKAALTKVSQPARPDTYFTAN